VHTPSISLTCDFLFGRARDELDDQEVAVTGLGQGHGLRPHLVHRGRARGGGCVPHRRLQDAGRRVRHGQPGDRALGGRQDLLRQGCPLGSGRVRPAQALPLGGDGL